MSKFLAELKGKAAQLPESERAEFALSLIESLHGPPDEGVKEAGHRAISRRIAEIERGEAVLISVDEAGLDEATAPPRVIRAFFHAVRYIHFRSRRGSATP